MPERERDSLARSTSLPAGDPPERTERVNSDPDRERDPADDRDRERSELYALPRERESSESVNSESDSELVYIVKLDSVR